MDHNEFYRLVNSLLYQVHEKLPGQIIPQDGHLVSDWTYRNQIRSIVNRIAAHTSQYSPRFEFQRSPFDPEKVVPLIPFFETSRMYAYRKSFQMKSLLQSLGLK